MKWKNPSKACRKGHPWVEGSYWVWRGYKHCRVCRRARWKARYAETRRRQKAEAKRRFIEWKEQLRKKWRLAA